MKSRTYDAFYGLLFHLKNQKKVFYCKHLAMSLHVNFAWFSASKIAHAKSSCFHHEESHSVSGHSVLADSFVATSVTCFFGFFSC